MAQKLLLVDFENVQQVDLGQLDESYRVLIFVGASLKNVPIELVTNAQRLGDRVEWQRVDANGRNALDFLIACQLGRSIEVSPKLHCIVLSKDKGFDPLLRHLKKDGFHCRRINSLLELNPSTVQADISDPNYARVVELLGKIDKKSRPRKRKTLGTHIASIFQNKLSQSEVNRIIDLLFAKNLLSEANGTVTYTF